MEVRASEQLSRITQEILRSSEFIFGWIFGYYEREAEIGKTQPVLLSTQLCTHYQTKVAVQLSKEERKKQKSNYSVPDIKKDLNEKEGFLPGGINLLGFWFSFLSSSPNTNAQLSQQIALSILEEGNKQMGGEETNEFAQLFKGEGSKIVFAFPITNEDRDNDNDNGGGDNSNFEATLQAPELYCLRDKVFGNISNIVTSSKEDLQALFEKERDTLLYISLSPFAFDYSSGAKEEKETQLAGQLDQLFLHPSFLQFDSLKSPIRLVDPLHSLTIDSLLQPHSIQLNDNEEEEEEEEQIILDLSKKKKQSVGKGKGKKNPKANSKNKNKKIEKEEIEKAASFFTLPHFTSQSILYFELSSPPSSSSITFNLLSNQYYSIKQEMANIQVLYYCKASDSVASVFSKLTHRIYTLLQSIFSDYFPSSPDDHQLEANNLIYSPPFIPHFIHPIFMRDPHSPPDSNLEERRKYHKQFLLPLNRPIFKSANSISFKLDPSSLKKTSKLINVHLGLPPSGVVGGTKYLVDGKYDYYHYRQDHFDDEGWGCAYRSMQTICSWLRYQSYTSKEDPSHYDIQQTLVDLGDKEKSFLRSRQWIGAVEISLCLNALYDIDCKIEFCNSGENIKDAARVIKHHFQTNGSPIMIGGGVLAYTLLGIDWNENTGDIKFLILDPHYVGAENINTIQSKGWCSWKDIKLFRKDAYYNLCMPQRPQIY